ncbi:hypothetical protein HGA91_03090 [candidate division WWE3 bacterium]|nr:hypothetical protein [candidate division WWE3 bacterium]
MTQRFGLFRERVGPGLRIAGYASLAILWIVGLLAWINGAGGEGPLFGLIVLLWPTILIAQHVFLRPSVGSYVRVAIWIGMIIAMYTYWQDGEEIPGLLMGIVMGWLPALVGLKTIFTIVEDRWPDTTEAVSEKMTKTRTYFQTTSGWVMPVILLVILIIIGLMAIGEWWYGPAVLITVFMMMWSANWIISLTWVPKRGRDVRPGEVYYYERPYWPGWWDLYKQRCFPAIWGSREKEGMPLQGGILGISRALGWIALNTGWGIIPFGVLWLISMVILVPLSAVILLLLLVVYTRIHLREVRMITTDDNVTVYICRASIHWFWGVSTEVVSAPGKDLNASHFMSHQDGLGRYCHYDPSALRIGSTAEDPIGHTMWMLDVARVGDTHVNGPLFKYNLDRRAAWVKTPPNNRVEQTAVFAVRDRDDVSAN